MTAFEFFKDQYDKNHEDMVRGINSAVEVDSFHFVEIAAKYCFGGTADVDAWFNINGVEDTREQIEKKNLKMVYGYRNGRSQKFVCLTKKGLKEFYKTMF